MNERFDLALSRINEIVNECIIAEPFGKYFRDLAGFVVGVFDACNKTKEYIKSSDLDKLGAVNKGLYADILPENYGNSYGNPAYAVKVLGEGYGQSLSFLYQQLRGIIPFAFEMEHDERRVEDVLILLEVFLEVYSSFMTEAEEKLLPKPETIRDILYWFVSDYADVTVIERIHEQLDPKLDFATRIIMDSNLEDISYLYSFGEYITDNELRTAMHLNKMSQQQIQAMADTYTEGYRIGFVTTGKDLSKKSTVNIRYQLGFERVVRAAILNFEKLGLKPVIYRAAVHAANGSTNVKIGYSGATANKQYDYDHREDAALYLDKAYKDRKLDLLRQGYEQYKELAYGHAGPAVIETFGEKPFSPEGEDFDLTYNDKQRQLQVEYASAAGSITNEYIKGEERSFTIIAFPIPEIGEDYAEIFDETVKINTLDYNLYKDMQQIMIDVLDKGQSVEIKGKSGNKTKLCIMLRKLMDPDKETQFENCVADVNIPVGEVFTSPVLEGSNGILNVSEVYLNELCYKNLVVEFEDGFVKDYSCDNFGTDEAGRQKGRKYFEDNVLFHHDTLPIGEFAIGTNTTAYAMAKRFNIFDRLPILIAEKTGPHFALGDTCYSHAEEVAVYNPDGKEIIAKDNTCSLKRDTDPAKAYFNCHTDITIPYDEIEYIRVCMEDGSNIDLIRNGRFVLDGLEELNAPL